MLYSGAVPLHLMRMKDGGSSSRAEQRKRQRLGDVVTKAHLCCLPIFHIQKCLYLHKCCQNYANTYVFHTVRPAAVSSLKNTIL